MQNYLYIERLPALDLMKIGLWVSHKLIALFFIKSLSKYIFNPIKVDK